MGDDDVDCRAVVEELFTFLDGELTEERRVQITGHMTGCIDCHEIMEFHAELKMSISRQCREDVPDSLRARIATSLGLPAPGGIYGSQRSFPGT